MSFAELGALLKQTFSEWSEDKAPRLAAALAYYTLFSIAPLLIIVIGIAGFFFGRSTAQQAILNQISGLMGQQSASAIQAILQNTRSPGAGIAAAVIGLIVLLLGASGVFGQLKDALNTMWEVRPKPGQGIGEVIRQRFFSFSMVLGVGFLLLVSLVISTLLQAFSNLIQNFLPGSLLILQIANFVVSFLVIMLVFALTFKFVPDAKIDWEDVWLGAAVTSLLFTIGKLAIGIYLGNSNVGSTYGIFSSLVIILIWVYYSAQILLLGAEFTRVYANMFGSHVVPSDHAEAVTEEMRQQQGIPRNKPSSQPLPVPQSFQPGEAGGVAGAGMSAASPVLVSTGAVETEDWGPTVWYLLRSAYPSLLALFVGLVGSVVIAREQRNPAPPVKTKGKKRSKK
jgi:membrane protein